MSKILYAMRSKAQFSYHESTLNSLLEAGADMHLAFDRYWTEKKDASKVAFEQWHGLHPSVPVEYFPIREGRLHRLLEFCRDLRSFSSYCARGDDAEFYRTRWSQYLGLSPAWQARINTPGWRFFLGARLLRAVLSLIERLCPPDPKIVAWLKQQQPEVLVASPCNMRFDSELELVKAAHSLRIPTVIPVYSWDNTSTKGLFHLQPTRLLAWHDEHRQDCIHYHHLRPDSIIITGAPFFDKWFRPDSAPTSRETFCRRVGLDPARPYLLYLGSSANIAADETWWVRDLAEALRASPQTQLQSLQILYRAHPANWKPASTLPDDGIPVWPPQGTLPDSPNTFADFRDSLAHAACVAGINTSGMLDAIIVGKPVLSPLIERYRLTQEKADHFVHMQRHDTLYLTHNMAGMLEKLANLLSGCDPLAKQRQAFIARFIRPRGLAISAGSRISAEILALARAGR